MSAKTYQKKKLKPNATERIILRVTPEELFTIKRLAKMYSNGNVSRFLKDRALKKD